MAEAQLDVRDRLERVVPRAMPKDRLAFEVHHRLVGRGQRQHGLDHLHLGRGVVPPRLRNDNGAGDEDDHDRRGNQT